MSTILKFSGKSLIAEIQPAYEVFLYIVDDTPQNSYEIEGPVAASTALTLPDSETYTDQNSIEVLRNGVEQTYQTDYNIVGGSPPRTQISFTVQLAGTRDDPDIITIRKI